MLRKASSTESDATIASVPWSRSLPAGLPPGTASASTRSGRRAATRAPRCTASAKAITDGGPAGLLDERLQVVGARFHVVRSGAVGGPRPPIVVADDPVIWRELRLERVVDGWMRVGVGSQDNQRSRPSLLPVDLHAIGALEIRHGEMLGGGDQLAGERRQVTDAVLLGRRRRRLEGPAGLVGIGFPEQPAAKILAPG